MSLGIWILIILGGYYIGAFITIMLVSSELFDKIDKWMWTHIPPDQTCSNDYGEEDQRKDLWIAIGLWWVFLPIFALFIALASIIAFVKLLHIKKVLKFIGNAFLCLWIWPLKKIGILDKNL